jgi:SAM-dependent methyltransferase
MKTQRDIKEYWEDRAVETLQYRGETFYTVTSLPFYIKRRNKMLSLLKEKLHCVLEKKIWLNNLRLLDFGCGNGYYSIWIKKNFNDIEICSCDLSTSMIDFAISDAQAQDAKIEFQVSDCTIPFSEGFDIVFINAVFAHIKDELLDNAMQNITDNTNSGGVIFIFEAIALNEPRQGNTWYRRTEDFYIRLFLKYGFTLEEKIMIAYPFFNKTDQIIRRILTFIQKRLYRNSKVINWNWNRSKLYLFLCETFMYISPCFDFFNKNPQEGNTFFVFKKAGTDIEI